MGEDFKEKLQMMKRDVAEAEALGKAMTPASGPGVSLTVTVVANAENLADMKCTVQVERLASSRDAPQAPLEWIAEEDFCTRLRWLRRMKSTYPGKMLSPDIDVWSSGKAAFPLEQGGVSSPRSRRNQ